MINFIKDNLDIISISISTIFFFLLFRYDYFSFYNYSYLDGKSILKDYNFFEYSKNIFVIFIFAFLTVFTSNVNYKELNYPAKVFILFHLAIFLFILLFKFNLDQHYKFQNIDIKYIVCFIGFMTIIKPAFIIVPILYSTYLTTITGAEMAAYNSNLDYITFSYYIIFFILTLSIYKYFRLFKFFNIKINSNTICFFILVSTAIHLAVYFNSGLGKVILGNYDPFYWINNNKTFFLTAHAQLSGLFNYGDYINPTDINKVLIKYNILINFLVLIFQLFSPFSFFKKKFYLFILIFFEFQHIIIFFVTGIFFWKWALFNILIYFIITNRNFIFPNSLKRKLFCTIFSLLFVFLFSLPRFAWLDTNYVNQIKIFILDNKGKAYEAPSNFFLNKSVIVAQNFPGPIVNTKSGNTFIWGSLYDMTMMEKINNQCEKYLSPLIIDQTYLKYFKKKNRESHSSV